jgi:hypothetical protein
VRLAGCSLDSRKLVIDLTRGPSDDPASRVRTIAPRGGVDFPMYPVAGANHSTILTNPPAHLVDLVLRALTVDSRDAFDAWSASARAATTSAPACIEAWQQFVMRALDERGDPITDYHVRLTTYDSTGFLGLFTGDRDVDLDVHTYAADPSLRAFHLNLSKLDALGAGRLRTLLLRVMASSGSALVAYHGVGGDTLRPHLSELDTDGTWDAALDLSALVDNADFKLFHPFTTTLIELRLNRDPLPLDVLTPKRLFSFEGERLP